MGNFLSKYNALDTASKKQVRDFINELTNKKQAEEKPGAGSKKQTYLISTWIEQDAHLIAHWSQTVLR